MLTKGTLTWLSSFTTYIQTSSVIPVSLASLQRNDVNFTTQQVVLREVYTMHSVTALLW